MGDIVAGMARHEYDLELRRYSGRGWRATFFLSGFEHSWQRVGAEPFGGSAARGRRRATQARNTGGCAAGLKHGGRITQVNDEAGRAD